MPTETENTTWIAGVAAAGGAVATAIPVAGAWLLNWMKTRRDLSKQARTDAIQEWQELLTLHQKEIAELKLEARENAAKVLSIMAREGKCQEALSESKVRIAIQDGQIQALIRDVRRLQILTSDSSPGVSAPCVIVATADDGIIRVASPSCGSLFGWLPEELQGQEISVLIPPEVLNLYLDKFKLIATGVTSVDPTKTIRTTAMKRNGLRFPVMISLSQWTASHGSILVNAEIRNDVVPQTGLIGPLSNSQS